MARVSRKNNAPEKVTTISKSQYNTAIYARLSREDGGNSDNDTIENQVEIISRFITESDDMKIKQTYIDNGYTGTNFDRPGFKGLMDDVNAGKIDCIVVKDLSRIGRDYISVGEYLYNIFPKYKVRVISINDNYDSEFVKDFDDIVVSLKNLVNASYSKDISKKISSSVRRKQEKGEFIGNYLYGYKKDINNKNKLVIDHDVSNVIVEIFKLRASGQSFDKIAMHLNENGIASPKKYLMETGNMKKTTEYEKLQWAVSSVDRITKNEFYIGHTVQGKSKSSVFEVSERVKKEDWIKAQNTHEPIIEMDLWNVVQSVNDAKKTTKKIVHKENIYKGVMFCGNCGLSYQRSPWQLRTTGEFKYYYVCRGRRSFEMRVKTYCNSIYIDEDILGQTLLDLINKHISLIDYKCIANVEKSSITVFEDEQNKVLEEIAKLKNLKISLYEKFEKKLIEITEYSLIYDKYNNSLDLLEDKNNELKGIIYREKKKKKNLLNAIEKISAYGNVESLNKEIIELLINKIIINKDNSILIDWKFKDIFNEKKGVRRHD